MLPLEAIPNSHLSLAVSILISGYFWTKHLLPSEYFLDLDEVDKLAFSAAVGAMWMSVAFGITSAVIGVYDSFLGFNYRHTLILFTALPSALIAGKIIGDESLKD